MIFVFTFAIKSLFRLYFFHGVLENLLHFLIIKGSFGLSSDNQKDSENFVI